MQLCFILFLLQIISFLQQNAHPCVIDKIPLVLENVTDQVSTSTHPSYTRHHLFNGYKTKDYQFSGAD